MPRRSKRVKSLRGATNNVGEQCDDDTHDETYESDMDVPSADTSDFEELRTKRLARRKTASARARPRRAGKLRQMLDMPLDVILEVCAYLQPKDILNLSRASKDLRKFFLNRNSASIWKTAISSFPNLPACPKDLSEPAYVDLMFGTHCHACAKKNCKDVYWLSRVRLCDECRKVHEVSRMLDAHSRDMIKPYELTELVPPIRYLDKWDEPEQPLFYGPELDEFLENLNKTSASNRREFLWKRKVLIDTREYGKHELAKFLRMLRDSRTNELENQRDARRSAIVARLKEAGHGEDTDYLLNEYRGDERRQFIMMPEVRKTQRLTEKSWNNMKDKILRFIENVREIRLKAARKATTLQRLGEMDRLVKEVVSTLRGHRPCTAEIVYRLPEVAQVIDPLYDGFDVQELERVLSESVPVYAKNRQEQLREEFRAFMVDLLGLDAETDPYNLAAVMWYSCSCCSRILDFDSVLHHICPGEHRTGNGPPGTMSKEVYSNFSEWAWYARGQHVSESAWWKYSQGIKAAAELIEKAGLDPKKATVDDIDNANVRIVQLGNEYYTTITSWRVALLHAYKGRLYNYRRATEAEISAAKPLEAIAEAQDERGPRSGYQCSRCDDLDLTTKDVVVQHLEEIHGITRPTDRDCIDRWPGSLPHIEVYLFCPERASTHAEWLVKDALEKGIGAYFDGWDDEAVTL